MWDSSYKVTYFFWLCVCTRCFSIWATPFVAVVWCKWAPRVIAFRAWNTPQIVSRNLKDSRIFTSVLPVVPAVSEITWSNYWNQAAWNKCLTGAVFPNSWLRNVSGVSWLKGLIWPLKIAIIHMQHWISHMLALPTSCKHVMHLNCDGISSVLSSRLWVLEDSCFLKWAWMEAEGLEFLTTLHTFYHYGSVHSQAVEKSDLAFHTMQPQRRESASE